MNEYDTPELPEVGLEPEDLDGHTIEELSDYLDAGRTPPDPLIDRSPGCQIALDALQRLRGLTPDLLAADTAAEPEADEGWVQKILSGIALDARAGRRIPIAASTPTVDLGVTEGAVRGVVRSAESAVPGVVIGRCRFQGDPTVPGELVRVRVDVSVPYGDSIPDLVARLRAEIDSRLAVHTTLNVSGIDITVHDILQLPDQKEEGR